MNALLRKWQNWKNLRKFAVKGEHCRFLGKTLIVDGHVEAGSHCHFRDNIILRTRRNGKIIFDDYAMVSWGVIIEALEQVHIGSNTGLAEYVIIRDSCHLFYGTKEHWRFTPHVVKPVSIGKDCFIGSRAYIFHGVTIGDGAVVGAQSVVTEGTQIGPYEIWAGVPARFISHRTDNVPPKKLQEAEELIKQYGLRQDRRLGQGESL